MEKTMKPDNMRKPYKFHSLWVLLSEERDRDGYALKPLLWEGAGEYQRVSCDNDLGVLVKVGGYVRAAIVKAQKESA